MRWSTDGSWLVFRGREDLELLAHRLDLLEALAVEIARADDAEAPGAERWVGQDRQAADLLPAEAFDLVWAHPHLRRRVGAVAVVLVDRLRDRLEVLRLRIGHSRILGGAPGAAENAARGFRPRRRHGPERRPARASAALRG